MNESPSHLTTRREFLKNTGRLAAASALAGVTLPHVHAAEDNMIQLALVGSGGRGTGAAANALGVSAALGPVKLVAMADVFENKLKGSYESLSRKFADRVDVPEDRKFIGFDGYKKAMDCLKPGDVAIFATPLAFRWVHFKYAIEKGLNVFMEKPIAADAPTARRMIALGEDAKKKNLKVAVGLMVRHCRGRQALHEQIKDGAIGDVITLRAYRMHGPQGSAFTDASMRKEGMSELLFQISRFHSFIWLSGGLFSDFYIHQIDETCWMKDAWPVKCHAIGGRHYRGNYIDQNFDHYQVEYTFEDGGKLFFYGRTMIGCKDAFESFAHGQKGLGVITLGSHHLQKAGRIFKGQNMTPENQTWSFLKTPEEKAPDPYEMEWQDLMEAIRNDQPYNEIKRAAEASAITSMGRFAAHTGQEVTFEDYMKSDYEFTPDADKLTMDSDPPLKPDAEGKYPVPEPGQKKDREY
jgi:predicted dehydrogenase